MLCSGEFNWIHKLLQYPSVNLVLSQYILMDDYLVRKDTITVAWKLDKGL